MATIGHGKTRHQWFGERTKTWRSRAGLFFHYYILVVRKFIDVMSLFKHSVLFAFSCKHFYPQSLESATYG